MIEHKKGLERELDSVRDIVRALRRLDSIHARIRALQYAWATVSDDSAAEIFVREVRGSGVSPRQKETV